MSTAPAIDTARPLQVPKHIGAVHVIVMNSGDTVPAAVQAMMSRSPTRFGLRIAGGCSGMRPTDRENMLTWFGQNLADFSGFVSSGATREVTGGKLDPMVTEVPALLASTGNVITISTVPRVGNLQLVDDSRLQIYNQADWGDSISHPNPGVHMIVMVQDRLGSELDWDGDVLTYVELFDGYRRTAGWQFATIVWNGGGVTKTEVKMALRAGWPVILVKGSGRAADEYITALETNGVIDLTLPEIDDGMVFHDPDVHNLIVVSKNDPSSLHDQLATLGFMP